MTHSRRGVRGAAAPRLTGREPAPMRFLQSGTLLAGALALMLAGPATAAPMTNPVYQEDYTTTPDGEIPEDWSVVTTGGDSSWFVDGDEYRFKADADNDGDEGLTIVNGDLDNGDDPANLTDYRVVGTVRTSDNNNGGLVARYTDPGSFYHLRRSNNDELELFSFVDGDVSVKDSTANNTISQTGIAEMIVEGASITGNWYSDGSDPLTDDPVATVGFENTTYTSGTFGLRTFGEDGSAFVDEQISVFTEVPEPGSLALLSAGAGLMLFRRRSRSAG